MRLGDDKTNMDSNADSPVSVVQGQKDRDKGEPVEKKETGDSKSMEKQPDAAVLSPEQELIQMRESLADAKKQAEETEKRLLYHRAEFSNYKKRVARDMRENIDFANEELIIEILESVDDFERAIASITGDDGVKHDKWVEGVRASFKKLMSVLSSQGVEPFESVGDRFDPQRHDALAIVEVGGVEPGTVVEEIKRGYLLKEKILRPAIVKVTKESPAPDAGGSETGDKVGNHENE